MIEYYAPKHDLLLKYGLAELYFGDDFDWGAITPQTQYIRLTQKGHCLIAKLLKAFEEKK